MLRLRLALRPEPELSKHGLARQEVHHHRGYTHHELEVLKSAVSKLPSLNS